jgi:beta-lactam-binding protein with PASTA domain
MSFWNLVAKRIFWRHMLVMGVVSFLLITLIQVFLYLFTFHWQKIELPDFRGQNIQEVQSNSKYSHFVFEITDSIYNNDKKPGTIVSQIPSPGSSVKKGRKIYVTIISSTPEMVKLPNLQDLTLRETQSIFQTYGLKIGHIKYVPDIGRTVLKAIYNGKEVEWGASVPKGAKIDLVVGNGSESSSHDEEIVVPKLIGLTREKALERINSLGLNIGKEVYLSNKENKNENKFRVVKQDPPASEKVEYGTEINLWYE